MDDLQITPVQVKQRLDRGETILLVDMREPWNTNSAGWKAPN